MLLPLDLPPGARVERRQDGVAGGVEMELGQLDHIRFALEQAEDLGAADHRDGPVAGQRERLIDRTGDFGALAPASADRG